MDALHASARRRDLDLLRVGSMTAVVFLHAAARILRTPENSPAWHLANLFSSLGSAAVPLFFMLSGALLLSSERTADVGYLLRRRLPRVAVPGLVWSLAAALYLWYRDPGEAAFLRFLNLPGMAVLTPYWFLYALVPLYLLSPLLKVMADHLEGRHWRYLLALWLVLTVGRKTVYSFLPVPWNSLMVENPTLNVSFLEGYLGYFLLGAWLEQRKSVPSRPVLAAVAGLSWAVIAVGSAWDSLTKGSYQDRFSSYQGLFAACLAASLFLLIKELCREGRSSGRALTLLSCSSFGVYLCHPFVIALVRLLWPEAGGVGGLLGVFLLSLAGSVALTVLLAGVKPLCFLFTGQRYADASKNSNLLSLSVLQNTAKLP